VVTAPWTSWKIILQIANWMVADELTAADIALLAYTRQAHLGGFDMAARPRLRNWVKRCEAALGLRTF
jgi:glutathione S-transferase